MRADRSTGARCLLEIVQFLLQGLKRDDIVMIPVNLHQHCLVHRGYLLVHLSYAVKLIVDLLELRVREVGHSFAESGLLFHSVDFGLQKCPATRARYSVLLSTVGLARTSVYWIRVGSAARLSCSP